MDFGKFYSRFEEHITLNRNMIAAATGGVLASMVAAEIADYLQNDPFVTAAVTSATKIITDVGLFLPLHFYSNRRRYVTHESVEWRQFCGDIFKIYLSAVPTIIAFYTISGMSNAYMLKKEVQAAASTAASYAIAFVPAQLLLTYTADRVGAVRRTPDHPHVRDLGR